MATVVPLANTLSNNTIKSNPRSRSNRYSETLSLASFTTNDTQPPPNLLKKQSTRWLDANHPLDTIDDYALLEKIRDVQEDNKHQCQNSQELTKTVVDHFRINDKEPYIMKRVKSTIQEMKFQDSATKPIDEIPLLGIGDFTSLKSDTSYANSQRTNSQMTLTPTDSQKLGCDRVDDVKQEEFCQNIGKSFISKIQPLLKDKHYTKQILIEECKNEKCKKDVLKYKDIYKCPCIHRISIILELYNEYQSYFCQSTKDNLIGQYLVYEKLYGYQQVYNDFLHIHKIHMCHDNESQILISSQLLKKYPCTIKICNANQRHSRERKFSGEFINKLLYRRTINISPTDKQLFWENDQTLLYSQKCDDIHAYFLHSQIHLGCNPNDNHEIDLKDYQSDNEDQEEEKKKHNAKSGKYLGAKEDKEWMNEIKDIDLKSELLIYNTLVKSMGVFKWQSSHGICYCYFILFVL